MSESRSSPTIAINLRGLPLSAVSDHCLACSITCQIISGQ